MSKVILSESLFKAMMEQLGYWAGYCDDSEGYLAGIMEEATKEAESNKETMMGLLKLPQKPEPRKCECRGWGCMKCCSSEAEIRSRQGTFG